MSATSAALPVAQTAAGRGMRDAAAPRTRLRGRTLLLARAAYAALLVLLLGLFVGGVPPWYRVLAAGNPGIDLTRDGAGRVLILTAPGLPAADAGIREGDVLMAVDGVPVPSRRSPDETAWRLAGPPALASSWRCGAQRGPRASTPSPVIPATKPRWASPRPPTRATAPRSTSSWCSAS